MTTKPSIIFIALNNVADNLGAMRMLDLHFDHIIFATERSRTMAEMAALRDGIEGCIVGVSEKIDEALLASVPRLRVIGSIGAGTDHIDFVAARSRGIAVVTSGHVNAVSVGEHALMLLLGLLKQVSVGDSSARSGEDRAGYKYWPRELRGKRVGILGAGHTAREFLRLLRPFGVSLAVWTPNPEKHQDLVEWGVDFRTLEEIFMSNEVVSINLPLTRDTQGLVGEDLLGLLPRHSIVLNVARLEIFDVTCLADLLTRRDDLMFGVDDFNLADSPFRDSPPGRCLLSPHMAGVTTEALRAMQDATVRALIDALENRVEG